ncbi:hypothetical protein AFL01nite_21280 [Aeromicrobium flavum]|uniref:Uncharacterized protein n=1 Tax=Aeromicrobium flavum TaxID=416568 RepID=A0A512HWJ1_9ACTN|nr:hypothetical protein [Aeromicrobium flavum]GEO89801.1 hypothetical protein AFL01nite_21280 [Aeromicrobium flavum]
MTTGAVLRAVVELALAYAVVGLVGAGVLALAAGESGADTLVPMVVLAVTLMFAAVVIVALARLVAGWLDDRVAEPEVVAIMVACALVLLSGVLTVPSLGLLAVAVAAVLALATHLVLTRRWT